MKKNMDVYSYMFGNAAGNYHCETGPFILKKALEKTPIAQHLQWFPDFKSAEHKQQQAALNDVARLSTQLATAVQHSVQNHRIFITLGGDHSAAIGSWSGAAAATENLGLIWFDAHMDSHTDETTPSHNIHGMPLAILLGHGNPRLTHILSTTPKVKPENTVLIGIRSYEAGEEKLLNTLGVKIFYMHDIERLGMQAVIQEAVAIVTTNTTAFGISIDLDGFDPLDAPGVGSPAPNGVRIHDFMPAFSAITHHAKFIGADIVEFNASLDHDHQTEALAVALFSAIAER